MGLVDIFRERTELDEIKHAFQFLISEYGFQLVEEASNVKHLKGEHFLVYRNDGSNLQLEICAGRTWFHCEIRRLLSGQPAKYNDKDNCIGFEQLAILESNNNYNHFDYFAGGSTGLSGVLANTAKLFQRHKMLLKEGKWIDVKTVQQLRNDAFETRRPVIQESSLYKLKKQARSFFDKIKEQATKLLNENGYSLLVDSDELSPFDKRGMVHCLTFEKANKRLHISQADWGDSYYVYLIEVGQKKVFEVDISNQDIDDIVGIMLEKLKQQM